VDDAAVARSLVRDAADSVQQFCVRVPSAGADEQHGCCPRGRRHKVAAFAARLWLSLDRANLERLVLFIGANIAASDSAVLVRQRRRFARAAAGYVDALPELLQAQARWARALSLGCKM